MIIFCNDCECKTNSRDLEAITTKDNKRALRGFCTECGCKKIILIGKHQLVEAEAQHGGDLVNFVNTIFPFEKHLPGHNWTGPGTNIAKRANEDLSPKEWSAPINRVDAAAYRHDIKYLNDDKEARHKADEEMIQELDNIDNPTFRERVERSIVKPILKTKRFLGLGLTPPEFRNLVWEPASLAN